MSRWIEKNVVLVLVLATAVMSALVAVGLASVVNYKYRVEGFAQSTEQAERPAPTVVSGQVRRTEPGMLLVVMSDSCHWCDRFRDELDPKYRRSEQSDRAPLRYIDIADVNDQRRYRLKGAVRSTPTLIVLDSDGQEVGRYVGYPGNFARLTAVVDQQVRKMK